LPPNQFAYAEKLWSLSPDETNPMVRQVPLNFADSIFGDRASSGTIGNNARMKLKDKGIIKVIKDGSSKSGPILEFIVPMDSIEKKERKMPQYAKNGTRKITRATKKTAPSNGNGDYLGRWKLHKEATEEILNTLVRLQKKHGEVFDKVLKEYLG